MWIVIHTAWSNIRQHLQTPWQNTEMIIFFIHTVTANSLFLILMHRSSREVSMAQQFRQERRHRLQEARRLSLRRKIYSQKQKKQSESPIK